MPLGGRTVDSTIATPTSNSCAIYSVSIESQGHCFSPECYFAAISVVSAFNDSQPARRHPLFSPGVIVHPRQRRTGIAIIQIVCFDKK
jgi:hypothetical protein